MQPLPMNELVKEQLEAVGFQVKLVPMDWNSLIDVYFSGANKNPTLDAINFSLSSIEPEQGIMKNGMTRYWPPNGVNWGYFSDPEVDKLGEESLAEFDVAKRNALIGKMHEKLVADALRGLHSA
jgi:peptide/nickel transport system substrate-binding protein